MSFQPAKADKCGKCGKTVYLMERQAYKGGYWHIDCFRCQSCKKQLATGQYKDHKEMPYCEPCYNKNFRQKGYGFGSPSTGLTSMPDNKSGGGAKDAPKSPKKGNGNFCSKCGTEKPDGSAKFCSSCGEPV